MAVCVHGNDPRTCMVCQTLREVDSGGLSSGAQQTATRQSSTRQTRERQAAPVQTAPNRPTSNGRASNREGGGGGHHVGFYLVVLALLVVLAIVSVWVVAGVVFTLIRLFDVILAAAVAGWLGYRIGRARGRREGR